MISYSLSLNFFVSLFINSRASWIASSSFLKLLLKTCSKSKAKLSLNNSWSWYFHISSNSLSRFLLRIDQILMYAISFNQWTLQVKVWSLECFNVVNEDFLHFIWLPFQVIQNILYIDSSFFIKHFMVILRYNFDIIVYISLSIVCFHLIKPNISRFHIW